jgi:DNA-binding protein
MNYVIACLSLFHSDCELVKIIARGQAISKAIDTVTLLKKAFLQDLRVQNICIGTQEFSKQNKKTRVSTIDITIIQNLNSIEHN